LNLGATTPYCIITPDTNILPSLKQPAQIDALHTWVDNNIASADVMIVSAEMYLYGGLIASRISNDSTALIMSRAQRLMNYSFDYPDLQLYVSNVVMRIPSYNGDFEEPWYWASYGADLYTYSYYLDKYNQTSDPEDLDTAEQAVVEVPSSAVDEFIWRRERNHNVTMYFLEKLYQATTTTTTTTKSSSSSSSSIIFEYFYTTLDDSAEYGFNIREAAEIKDFISDRNMSSEGKCPVYPGADEVHLTMLAKYCVNSLASSSSSSSTITTTTTVNLGAIFRDPSVLFLAICCKHFLHRMLTSFQYMHICTYV
jgi:hypothetical protein